MKYKLLIKALCWSFTAWSTISLVLTYYFTRPSSILYQVSWILGLLASIGGLMITSNQKFINKVSDHLELPYRDTQCIFMLSHLLLLIFCFLNIPVFKNNTSIVGLIFYVFLFVDIYIGLIGLKNIQDVYHGIPIVPLICLSLIILTIILYMIHVGIIKQII